MQQAEEIRRRVLWWRENGDSMRYPADLRRIIVDYTRQRVDAGVSVYRVGHEIGMRKVTLRRWLEAAAQDDTEDGSSALVPVRVGSTPGALVTRPLGQRTVTSPTGWRVDGLDIDEVVTLLREMS